MTWKSRSYIIFLLYLLIAVGTRLFSFFPAVIDWDESTYILGADALRLGLTPYIDFIDTKPPGVFYLLVPFSYFTHAWIPLRVFTAFLIASTAFLIHLILREMKAETHTALFGGFLYLVAASFLSFSFASGSGEGLAFNTEHATNPMIALAILLGLRQKYWASGILMALAFWINFLIAFSALALLLLFRRDSFAIWVKDAIGTFIGFALTLGLLMGLMSSAGYLEAYLEVFSLTREGYANHLSPLEYAVFVTSILYSASSLLLCFTVFGIYGKFRYEHSKFLFLLVWIVLAFIGAGFTARYFFHYALPVFVPLSIICSGYLFRSGVVITRKAFITVAAIAIAVLVFKIYSEPGDNTAGEIAHDLENNFMSEGESIYIQSNDQIIYHLLDQLPPTRYYHPGLISNADHRRALEIGLEQELQRIFNSKPDWVIDGHEHLLDNILQKEYVPANHWKGGRQLYRLKKD